MRSISVVVLMYFMLKDTGTFLEKNLPPNFLTIHFATFFQSPF